MQKCACRNLRRSMRVPYSSCGMRVRSLKDLLGEPLKMMVIEIQGEWLEAIIP